MASGPITSWEIEKQWEQCQTLFFGAPKSLHMVNCGHEIKRRLLLGRKVVTNLDSIMKKQSHHFVNKGPSSQGYGFCSGHVWMQRKLSAEELMFLNCGVGEDS